MAGAAARLLVTARVASQVLRNRSLRGLELAFLAFNTVEYGSWVAILLYAYEATGPASVGVVALVQLLPAALVAPAAATFGDRASRRRVLGAGYLVLAGLTLSTALGMLVGGPPVAVYLAAMTASMSLTIVRPTHNAILPSLAGTPEELTAANAVSSIAEAGGLLAGPLTAAAILAVADPAAVLVVMAMLSALAAVLVSEVRQRRPEGGDVRPWTDPPGPGAGPSDAAVEQPPTRLLAGFRALAADADARLVVGVLGARALMVGVTDVLFVLLALELFGTGESGAALLSAAMGVGGIIGGGAAFLLVGRQRIAPILAACGVVWGATFAAMGLAASGSVAPLLLAVGGTGLSVMDVAGRTILQRAVRDQVLARVFGVLEGLMMAALAAGAILVPVVVGAFGLEASVLVFASLLPVVLAVASPGLRALDRRATAPLRAIALLRRLRLFEALDPPAMELLGRAAGWLTVPAGTMVIREGDRGDRFYVLESGALTVSRNGTFVRTLASRGDGFGEIALLRDVPRTATVTADRETVVLALDREAFLAAVTGHPLVRASASGIVEAHLLADRTAFPGP